MIYEVVTLVTRHLQDGAMGVNALRASVPLDPLDPPIETVTVRSEFELEYLAGEEIPASAYEEGPLVLVRRGDDAGEFSAPGNPEILGAPSRVGVAILVFFPRRQQRALHQENRCLSALLRVVRRSVGLFFEDVPIADRNLRDVQITDVLAPPRMVPTMTYVSERDLLAGAVLCDLRVLDRWADGITA